MRISAGVATVLAIAIGLSACGGPAPAPLPPAAGLVLLGLDDGGFRGQLELGSGPRAIGLSADGRTAFLSDTEAGAVHAVAMPQLRVLWSAQVGGRPGSLLSGLDFLFVSLEQSRDVIELDARTGAVRSHHPVGCSPGQLVLDDGRVQAACSDGTVRDLEGSARAGGHGTGLALGPNGLWGADGDPGVLVEVGGPARVKLPPGLRPSWLAQGSGERLLVAASAPQENTDPGGLLLLDTDLRLVQLAAPRDPDHVLEYGGRIFVAAHGDHEVTVYGKGQTVAHWLRGGDPVALAPAVPLGVLVVVTDSHE